MKNSEIALADVASITMGTSPKGDTYNNDGIGMPLLNGPTEFGPHHPFCTLFTTDSRKECKRGDLIFCVRGSTTGRMNWADQVYSLGRGVCSIRGKTLLDTKFIKYCLDYKLEALLKLAGGGTFPNLTKDDIFSFPIPYPPHRYKIAAILSAYDDLIENNTRRIAILEQMAQAIYREWFGHFRFPGHEGVRLVESDLGPVPEGWGVGCIGDLYEVKSGFAFKSVDMTDEGNIAVIKIRNIDSNSVDIENVQYIPEEVTQKADLYELFEGDLLIAMTGAKVGKIGIMPRSDRRNFLNQRVGKFFPIGERLNNQFIYHIAQSNYFQTQINNLAQGAAQPNISGGAIESISIIIPSDEMIKYFEEICSPLNDLMLSLEYKNTTLRQTRDLLLPRLIAGEVDVSALAIDLGEN